VDRTTDGAGAVKTMTFDELRALDAGYPFTQDGGATYPYRGTGVQVPTLEEVLAAHPDMLFNIEIKQQSPSIVDETVATIEAAGLADRVILGSFYDGVTREIREVAPDILTVMGTLEGMELYNLAEVYEDTYQAPTPLFAAPVEFSGLVMTEDLVAKANRVGVHIHAWTVNDRAEMEAVFDMGAEGIITDDPVTLADVIAGRSR
jgi:glycerophosphoryl diester phosphodiesterase